MKILTGIQIKEVERFTIEKEPVQSIALMERAAEMIAQAICRRVEEGRELLFLIGKGNNGGDGLAVARMMSRVGFDCSVCMVQGDNDLSDDCRTNYERLPENVNIVNACQLLRGSDQTVIVDAMLGSGVTGEAHGAVKEAIRLVNSLLNTVISIDLPSGMKTEFGNDPENIVHADTTLVLEFPKLAMLLPEAGECCGEIEILPIELDLSETESDYFYTEVGDFHSLLKPRLKFGHKGSYGHALLVCGSKGMTGAAILSTCGALRSGCGLVTTHMPENEASALHANAPSAMVSGDAGDRFTELPACIEKFSAIGVGCGLGTAPQTADALGALLRTTRKPLVIDADALNIIACHPEFRPLIPANSILTPHPGEFKRLAGEWSGEKEKLTKLRSLCSELHCLIILKGSNTAICTPDGRIFFNSTGSVGMAKAGSGDILTGLLTGILAQGYVPEYAALLGVWLHGRAGEKAEGYFGADGMNSTDIIDFIPEAWSELR